ncbi:exodeoxyribonuclease VII large subunit [Anaerosacchariphilus polymeriproducens]|uniref:Exodeoxyribonuclease 7 large subunit n=1 Tax=Anaerosacchariphilus polymeriproducens TaxID=1812858 RepID=A0A371AZ40_9FIRM|nr:exodeoxyribonuclease VII large subunit [Anaerosacchariphilus polymeriproducens]RDU24868.1 exodeoxyribonuclease VII large subunit [Anaerosacchariphilus polymeriproducens]
MQNVYSVGQVNKYIKTMFEQDFFLKRIYIKGEVSNCKYHSTGHIYFTLKDETGSMAVVMFAGQRKGLAFRLTEGQKIIVLGSVSVYERDGKYQLYAQEIVLDGIGALYQRFEQLKQELEEMGMFSVEYKRPIPRFIKKLGVVTAPTGAVIHDISNVAYRRNPYIQIILYPAFVQGEGAKESIVKGIQKLDQMGLDCIIVGRGGGSIEDLWAFNEECVARAIFECTTPVISAVGHETDVTIADYVADLRAPTPSAAAELAVYDLQLLQQFLIEKSFEFKRALQDKIKMERKRIEKYEMQFKHLSPQSKIRDKRQYLMNQEEKINICFQKILQNKKHRLQIYIEKFKGLSPLDKLQQGYSFVENHEHHAISRIGQVQIGDSLQIHVSDGTIKTQVEQIEAVRREL